MCHVTVMKIVRMYAAWRLLPAIAAIGAMTGCNMTEPALLSWSDLSARPREKPDVTIAYGDDAMQKIDLWRPSGAGPHPVVVMVHGGCWQTSIADRRLMDWAAADLRDQGIAVWNIDYRGVDRDGGGYPGTFADVAAAADRLAIDGPKLGLKIDRVVAVGHSAGGHLALWLAGRARLPATSPLRSATPLPIAHVISLGGLPDLAATEASPENGCGTDIVGRLVGRDRVDRFADTSVPRLLPLGVPQELIHGRDDRIIPHALATGYLEQARTAGDPVRLQMIADTGHVELIAPGSAAWTETVRRIRAALGIAPRP